MSFGLEDAIEVAEQLVYQQASRNLKDVEITVLRGAWDKLAYGRIATQNKYSASYISQDAAPELWKLLSNALGEKVRKSNFKAALKRCWEDLQPNATIQYIADQYIAEQYVTESDEIADATACHNTSHYATSRYIERPFIDEMCYEALMRPGALVRIRAPRRMGKTAIASHLISKLSCAGYPAIRLSFELADRNVHFTDFSKLLRWMCLTIEHELGYSSHLDDVWDESGLGAKVSCSNYFERYLLQASNKPLILCLDNIELLFSYPHVDRNFFDLLHAWNEKGKTQTPWGKLRFLITQSTEQSAQRHRYIQFNPAFLELGLTVDLPELSFQQVKAFAKQYGISGDAPQLKTLMRWVGGHPYLLEKAFTYASSYLSNSLEALFTDEFKILEIYHDYLHNQWMNLRENPELMSAFAQVVKCFEPVCIDPILAYQLQGLNLVKQLERGVVLQCKLYGVYFKKYFSQDGPVKGSCKCV